MKHLFVVFTYLVSLAQTLLRQGGIEAVVAENLLLKQQPFVLTHSRKRAVHLSPFDRFFFGQWCVYLDPCGIKRMAVLFQSSALLKIHRVLAKRIYRLLYSLRERKPPGPKGSFREVIELVVEMKRRNSKFGCIKIAKPLFVEEF